jgi:hypothetical protein
MRNQSPNPHGNCRFGTCGDKDQHLRQSIKQFWLIEKVSVTSFCLLLCSLTICPGSMSNQFSFTFQKLSAVLSCPLSFAWKLRNILLVLSICLHNLIRSQTKTQSDFQFMFSCQECILKCWNCIWKESFWKQICKKGKKKRYWLTDWLLGGVVGLVKVSTCFEYGGEGADDTNRA